jgi:hypothetical protein
MSNAKGEAYAFNCGVIKLNERDLEAWRRAYEHINLEGELYALADWAADQKNWFNAVASSLAKKNRTAQADKDRIRIQAETAARLQVKRPASRI